MINELQEMSVTYTGLTLLEWVGAYLAVVFVLHFDKHSERYVKGRISIEDTWLPELPEKVDMIVMGFLTCVAYVIIIHHAIPEIIRTAERGPGALLNLILSTGAVCFLYWAFLVKGHPLVSTDESQKD